MHFVTFILVISCTDMVPTTSTGLPHVKIPQFKIEHIQILLQKITIPEYIIQFPRQSESFNEESPKYLESALNNCDYYEFIRLKELFQRNNFKIINPQELLLSLLSINYLLSEIIYETFSYKDILIEFHLRTMNIIKNIESLNLYIILESGFRAKEIDYLNLLFSENSQEAFYSYCTKSFQYLLKTKSILVRTKEAINILKLRYDIFYTATWNTKSQYTKNIISGKIKTYLSYIPNSIFLDYTRNVAGLIYGHFNLSNIKFTNKKYVFFWVTMFIKCSSFFLDKNFEIYKGLVSSEIINDVLNTYNSLLNRSISDLSNAFKIYNLCRDFDFVEIVDHLLSNPEEFLQLSNHFNVMLNDYILSLKGDIYNVTKYFQYRNPEVLDQLNSQYKDLKFKNKGRLDSLQNKTKLKEIKLKIQKIIRSEIQKIKNDSRQFYFKRQAFIDCHFFQESFLIRINEAINSILLNLQHIPNDLKYKYEEIIKNNIQKIQETRVNISSYLNPKTKCELCFSSLFDPFAEYFYNLADISKSL